MLVEGTLPVLLYWELPVVGLCYGPIVPHASGMHLLSVVVWLWVACVIKPCDAPAAQKLCPLVQVMQAAPRVSDLTQVF